MAEKSPFRLSQVSDTVYAISEADKFGENPIIYAIIGDDKLIVIDSGCGSGNILEFLKSELSPKLGSKMEILSNNIFLLNTHNHFDHVGGNHFFTPEAGCRGIYASDFDRKYTSDIFNTMGCHYDEEKSWWKWLVLAASFTNNALILGLAWGAGVFQVMFMEVFPGKAGVVSFIPTMVPAVMSLMGPISSILCNMYGCRLTTGIGGLIASVGLMISAFGNSKLFLLAAFAFVGLGLGLAMVPSVVVVCYFFTKQRAIASSLGTSGVAFGTFAMPPLVRLLVTEYGWRGSLLIVGALTLNIIVMSATFRPIKLPEEDAVNIPKHIGYNDNEAAVFVSVAGASALCSRILCGLYVQKMDAPFSVYAAIMGLSGFGVILAPFASNTWTLSALCAVFGLGTGTFGLLPLIVTDLVGIQALNAGYGYLMVAEGLGSLLGPPISGFLFDATSGYTLSLCVAGSVMVIGSVIMMIPMVHVRRRNQLKKAVLNVELELPKSRIQASDSCCSERPLLLSVDSQTSNPGAYEGVL